MSMEKVTWMRESRRGYGYITPVAACVVKRNARTVRIAVLNLTTRRIEKKNVKADKLEPRTNVVPGLDDTQLEESKQ